MKQGKFDKYDTCTQKQYETTDHENYRPMSVLPLPSKIFEKKLSINEKLSEYMENFKKVVI